jgi:hypothetical protein
MMRRTFILLALLSAVFVLVTSAAAGGSKPSLAVSPAAPVVGDSLSFSGCGWAAGQPVTLVVYSGEAAAFFGVTPGQDGCFDSAATETYTAEVSGDYQLSGYQGHGQQPDAIIHFTVR